jgi:DNA (cytosine-5)-methyltransferase 1
MNRLKVLSLFSGIGSFERALLNLGIDFKLVGFSEIDKYAIESYCAVHNVDKSLNLGDVSKINTESLSDFSMLTHGSPCQSFSYIGQQEGGDEDSGTKSSLMWETVKIIKAKKPKYVIWENVKAVVGKKHKHNFDKYIESLEELGYKNYHQILNALDYNVAQNRERLFVVSILNDTSEYKFPPSISLNKSLSCYLDEKVNEKYIVPDQVMKGYQNKKSIFRNRFRLRDLSEYAYCLIAKPGRAVITNNYIYNDLSMYQNKPCDNSDLDFLADNKIPVRALTPIEYWRLQGYNDEDFYKAQDVIKSDAQLYKQAGNSICVNVVEALLHNLLKK